jgi:hypothetical protein
MSILVGASIPACHARSSMHALLYSSMLFYRGSGWKLEPAEYEVTLFFPPF